jgi:hypothetical protein
MISQWVRVRLLQRALQPVWEGLAEGAWSPTQLAELTALWQSYRLLPDCAFTLDAERASTLWTIDCIRRSPEPEALIDSFEGLPPIEAYVGGTFLAGSLGRVLPGGWYAREKVGYSRLFQTVVRSGFDPGQERVWPKEITANAAEAQRQHLDARRSYLGALLRHEYAAAAFYSHDLERIVRRFCYTQAVIDQAIIACALESCRRAHGEYPGNLQALAPGFLARLPNDVLTGAPYQYRRTGGGFVLYSIGWDQQDDHGTVVLTKDGSLDLRKGDWVWEHPSN